MAGARERTPLRTDSPLCRLIARSFVDFLGCVDVAPGVDREGLEVAKQCLVEAFRLNERPRNEQSYPYLLPELFLSNGLGFRSVQTSRAFAQPNLVAPSNAPTNPINVHQSSDQSAYSSLSEERSNRPSSSEAGRSSTEAALLEQFMEGLENSGYFDVPKDSNEYSTRQVQAKNTFDSALKKYKKQTELTEEDTSDVLAEAFKVQGNLAMSAKRHIEAIELYTLAISICGYNAIFYANRAAAHTEVGNYDAAIGDCKKALDLNPRYSKAYSRLGIVYYAQGHYLDAIEKGFKKALELDPTNSAVKESMQAAQKKLEESIRSRAQTHAQPANGQDAGVPSAVNGTFSSNLGNFFNLVSQWHDTPDDVRNSTGSDDSNSGGVPDGMPEVRIDGNINMLFDGEELPSQYMHPIFNMFGGTQSQRDNEGRHEAQRQANEAPSESQDAPQFQQVPSQVAGIADSVMQMFAQAQNQQGNASFATSGSTPGPQDGPRQLPPEFASFMQSALQMFGGFQHQTQSSGENAPDRTRDTQSDVDPESQR